MAMDAPHARAFGARGSSAIIIFSRTAFSPRTFLTQGQAISVAPNAGILLSTVLNVQLPCQLTVLCTRTKEMVKIVTVFVISRVTAITSTKARCAWDFGSVIVPDSVEVMTPTQAGIQCPGSLLKKFPNLRLRSREKISIPA